MSALFFCSALLVSGASSWQEAVLAEATSLITRQPELSEAFENLRGLTPSHYLMRRRPEPEVTRELQRRQIPGAVLIAFYRQELTTTRLSEAERSALRDAILLAVGKSGHPAAFPFLVDIVESDAVARDVALYALAQTSDSGVGSVLRRHAAHAKSRAAVVRAAGTWRTPESLQLLVDLAPVESRAVARALGMFAAPSAWSDRGAPLRQQAALGLVTMLSQAADAADAQAAMEALLTARHPATSEPLARLATSKTTAASARAAAARAVRLLRPI